MEESILISIKKLLGIMEDDNSFDTDIVISINSVFSALTQMGVGPEQGYSISGPDNKWSEYIGDSNKLQMIKSYVHMRVRLLFDPPTSTAVLECTKELAKELEWRLYTEFDLPKKEVTSDDGSNTE